MNNYITLDGKKYATQANDWTPMYDKPATARYNLNGGVEVTYGPGVLSSWEGTIRVYQSPPSGYGSLTDFITTYNKLTSVSMTDHGGTTHTVHLIGAIKQKSLTPMWDSNSNVYFIPVKIVKE